MVKERRIADACRLARGQNVFGCFDDRHKHRCVFGQSHLRAAGRVGANRLHAQSVRQDAMMPNLVDLPLWQLQPRRKLSD